MNDIVISTRVIAETVLDAPHFEPPPGPAATKGAIADLRSVMARFSSSSDHPRRRAAVEAAIATLNDVDIAEEAKARTLSRLDGNQIDVVAELGFVVPSETLGAVLGVAEDQLERTRLDVAEVVRVIGRQEPPEVVTDEVVARLIDQFEEYPSGPVAPISLLYQNHDATTAFFASKVVADHHNEKRRSALAKTVRIAIQDTRLDDLDLSAGTTVIVDLESTGLEFGAGPHHCPGQQIAEKIAAGMCSAIEARGYELVAELSEFHPDGRPKALFMSPS